MCIVIFTHPVLSVYGTMHLQQFQLMHTTHSDLLIFIDRSSSVGDSPSLCCHFLSFSLSISLSLSLSLSHYSPIFPTVYLLVRLSILFFCLSMMSCNLRSHSQPPNHSSAVTLISQSISIETRLLKLRIRGRLKIQGGSYSFPGGFV